MHYNKERLVEVGCEGQHRICIPQEGSESSRLVVHSGPRQVRKPNHPHRERGNSRCSAPLHPAGNGSAADWVALSRWRTPATCQGRQVETLQNDFFDGTKLPISLKTNGRGDANPGTKLPFAANRVTKWCDPRGNCRGGPLWPPQGRRRGLPPTTEPWAWFKAGMCPVFNNSHFLRHHSRFGQVS